MWKPLLLPLLVPLRSRIFLVSMCNYEAKSPLFTTDLYHIPIKNYSKNIHPFFILKWILVVGILCPMLFVFLLSQLLSIHLFSDHLSIGD